MTSSTAVDDAFGHSAGYPRKRARTRRSLLSAGMVVIADKGPDGATVGEIVARAQVSSGTFYNHFLSIEDLVDAMAGELGTAVEIGRDTLNVIENDPAMRVLIGASQLLGLVAANDASAAAFVTLLATVPAFRDRVRHIVSSALSDGIDAGRFIEHDLMSLTDAVLGSVVQWMRTGLAHPGGVVRADAQLRIVLAIIGVDGAEAPALLDQLEAIA